MLYILLFTSNTTNQIRHILYHVGIIMGFWSSIFKPLDDEFCDGCGEPYPFSHLEYVLLWDGYFCKRCSIMEGDEDV